MLQELLVFCCCANLATAADPGTTTGIMLLSLSGESTNLAGSDTSRRTPTPPSWPADMRGLGEGARMTGKAGLSPLIRVAEDAHQ